MRLYLVYEKEYLGESGSTDLVSIPEEKHIHLYASNHNTIIQVKDAILRTNPNFLEHKYIRLWYGDMEPSDELRLGNDLGMKENVFMFLEFDKKQFLEDYPQDKEKTIPVPNIF